MTARKSGPTRPLAVAQHPTPHPGAVTPNLNASERIGGALPRRGVATKGGGSPIAAIHVLKSRLRMADDDYRALLLHLTGRSSSKDCTPYQQRQVRRHLQQLAERAGVATPYVPPAGGRPVTDRSDEASKVRALWLFLHELGQVRDPSESALLAYTKRVVHVDALEWSARDRWKLIEGLKDWAMRVLPGKVAERRQQLRGAALPPGLAEELARAEQRLAAGVADNLKRLFDRHEAVYQLQRRALEHVTEP